MSGDTTGGKSSTSPNGAPANSFETFSADDITISFHDNFETNTGWTVENLGATSGDWQRGVPVNDPNWAYDPISDSDGSGQCFLTQNELGNTDVDNGAVRLTSPVLDLSGGAGVKFDYFLNMTNGSGTDRLLVEINTTGGAGAWTEVARIEESGALNWQTFDIRADDFAARGVTPTAQSKIRFTANDANPQSIVEAGIDAFKVTKTVCDSCPCDCNFDTSTGLGVCDILDFLAFQDGFVGADPCACDRDTSTGAGVCDIFDFLAFQDGFVQGCP
ncbi:MAG: hypothetical protein IIC49_01590 [Planctomycetes bacterium]|nr:hypothetical protein [Planctomycetota bacterium]